MLVSYGKEGTMKIMNKMNRKRLFFLLSIMLIGFLLFAKFSYAENAPTQPVPPTIPRLDLNVEQTNSPADLSESIQLLVVFTVLSLLPSIILMMTSFTRIVVILSFLKQAIGAQQSIPSQLMVGLTIFLTLFIMSPALQEGYTNGIDPYMKNEITQGEAIVEVMKPLREFMFKQTRQKDIELFLELSKDENLANKEVRLDLIPNRVLIPSFIISELKTAFQIGFLLYIPFIIIDMVVSSTLMSMGMMMLPPMMISMPFKILLFILVDGWDLVIKSIVLGFK